MDPSRIKLARKAANMTQVQLAEELGINRATISKYESGEIGPSIGMLERISNALHCSLDYLLGFDVEMKPSAETKALIAAIKRDDTQLVKKILNSQSETTLPIVFPISDSEKLWLENKIKSEQDERNRLLNKVRTIVKFTYHHISERDTDILCELIRYCSKLNSEGQKKAVERVQELTEIPRYQRTPEPPDTHTEPQDGKGGHSED